LSDKLENRANGAYNAKEFEKAMSLFDSLIAKYPKRGEFYYKSAYCHMVTAKTVYIDIMRDKTPMEKKILKEKLEAVEINNFLTAIRLGYNIKESYLGLGVIYSFIDDSVALNYFRYSLREDSNYEKAKHEIDLCQERIETNKHLYDY
jgi:hypothetical protein